MDFILSYIVEILASCWHMLQDASIYILIGLLAGGLLKVFLSAAYVASHLGQGRFLPVFKAALLGIPLPLCSCGVLPAAASLKKQGANNGATTAFLISTPESGIDSIAVSWALLDPLMTIFRPLSAFISAVVAGIAENLLNRPPEHGQVKERPLPEYTDNGCCGNNKQPPAGRSGPRESFFGKARAGIRYAVTDLWQDLAGSFFIGVFLAGVIGALIPDEFFAAHLGGGLLSMLIMLVIGIPMYICATASTPIAAAFILKGVSPGAALVFLLVGPATNIASLTVLAKLLGRRATVVYLVSISIVSIGCGLALDQLYFRLAISASAVVGEAAEIFPVWLKTMATLLLLVFSVKPVLGSIRKLITVDKNECGCPGQGCQEIPIDPSSPRRIIS